MMHKVWSLEKVTKRTVQSVEIMWKLSLSEVSHHRDRWQRCLVTETNGLTQLQHFWCEPALSPHDQPLTKTLGDKSPSQGCGTEGGGGCEVRGKGRGTVASPGLFLKKTSLKQTLCPKEGSHSNLPGFSWKKGLHISTGAGHNKVPQNERLQLQKWIFSQFCRLDIQSQATSSVGLFWELSP